MLFAVTTWIIALTVIGILAVCVFRALCEPESDKDRTYGERIKPAPEANHYEPLNHELKKIEAAGERKHSGKPVKEAVLLDVKTVAASVSEEKKPLNTQSADDENVLREVRISNAAATAAESPGNAPTEKTVVIETQHNGPAPVSPAAGAILVNVKIVEPNVSGGQKPLNTQSVDSGNAPHQVRVSNSTAEAPGTALVENGIVIETQIGEPAPSNSDSALPESAGVSSLPPMASVSNVTVNAAAPISETIVEQKAILGSPQDPSTDIMAAEQPNSNDVPTPYHEVESATLPRTGLNGPSGAFVKMSVLPA